MGEGGIAPPCSILSPHRGLKPKNPKEGKSTFYSFCPYSFGYYSPTSWLVRGRTRYKGYSIRGRTIHPRLSLFHAPARLSYCPSRQFIHMAALLSYLLHLFSWCSPLRYFYSHGVLVCLASYPPNHFFWLFTSTLIIHCYQCYIYSLTPFAQTTRKQNFRVGNSRLEISITRKMVHPSPILLESRFGSSFILSKLAMSHAFSGPRFPYVVACNLFPYLAT